MKFSWTTFLLVLLLVAEMDAKRRKVGKGGKGRKEPLKAAKCNPNDGKLRKRITPRNPFLRVVLCLSTRKRGHISL